MEGARAKYVSTWLCTAVCAGILVAAALPALAQSSSEGPHAYFGATQPPSFVAPGGEGRPTDGSLAQPGSWSSISTVTVRDETGTPIVGSKVRYEVGGQQGLATPITPGTFYFTNVSGKVTLTVEPSARTKSFSPEQIVVKIPEAPMVGRTMVTAVTIDIIAGRLVTNVESSLFGANQIVVPPQPVGGGCPGGGGDCCSANGTPGCDDVDCCTLICGIDPFCCDVEWDGICADEAAAACAICQGPPPGDCGDCNVPDPAGEPGCSDPVCEAIICAIDPFCCDVAWDSICADEAIANCNCGGGGGGSNCCTEGGNGGVGCDDPVCEAQICAIDPFCCDVAWDGICADEAQAACEVCGGMPPPPPSDCLTCTNNEGEPCGDDTNGGCNSAPPVFGNIACDGTPVCGTSWAAGGTRDTDWYLFCTSGSTNVTANLTAEGGGHVLFIVDGIAACAPVVVGVAGSAPAGCGAGAAATATVGAGTFVVFVAPDVFDGQPCDGVDDYSVTMTTNVPCTLPCEVGPPPDPCEGASGDCCVEGGNGTPGCDDPDCCAAICAIDPFCCDVSWDGICADEAQANAACNCGGPPPGGSNCCTEGGNGGVGCDDPECEAMICAIDPFCCDIAWDGICADEAQAACEVCQGGGGGCGDCNVPDPAGRPGCSDPVCEAIVCALDPFCCDIAWDGICANEAIANCDCGGGPGNPACNENAGSCCSANGTPGCNDPECCNAICAIDPFCCDVSWDGICASEAQAACEGCAPMDCLTCTNNEGEPCGSDANGGCNSVPPVFGEIECNGASICGTIWATGGTRDTDWFQFSTTAAGTNVTLTGTSEVDAVLFIVDGIQACLPVVVGVAGSAPANCGAGAPATATLGVGTFVAFIAPSAFEGAPCGGSNDYTIALTTSAPCGEPPPPPEPPANDLCVDAESIDVPSITMGTTILATNDGQPACGSATGQSSNGVWYSLIGTGNNITLSTCGGAAFDTEISVWCGDCPAGGGSDCCVANGTPGCDDPECEAIVCAVDPFCCDVSWDGICAGEANDLCEVCMGGGGLQCVAGNDDFCGLQTQVTFCSQAGAEYLVLVFGFGSAQGNFTLTATGGGSCTATVQCIELGACCYCDESNVEVCDDLTAEDCAALGGDFNAGETCAAAFLGYVSADCANPFLNISGTGTLAPTASASDDAGDAGIPIGFTFNFFGTDHTTIGIASNGYLTFGATLGDFTNDPIPNAANPNDLIAPYWDDWAPNQGGDVYYQTLGSSPNRVFVAQWNNVPHFGGTGNSTFEALLHESTNCVEYRYADISFNSPTVGVENQTGTVGSSVPGASIVDNDCVTFCPQSAEGYDCEADDDTTCVIVLPLDIKNGACPAPFNRTSNGVTPVAILSGGSEGVDAADVDVSSLSIMRCDGVGGSVAPLDGPHAPKLLNGGTPTDEQDSCGGCACHDQSNDGLQDLTMKFSNDEMTDVLELDGITDGALVALKVTGQLNDGTPFEAYDCVQLVPPGGMDGGQTAQIAVDSNVPNAWIAVSPLDLTLDGGGFASFSRHYPLSQLVTLGIPKNQGSTVLVGWELNGVFTPAPAALVQPSLTVKATVQIGEISTFNAIYQPTKSVPTPPGPTPAPSKGGGASIGG